MVPGWDDAAELLPLVASQTPFLVLFRLVRDTAFRRLDVTPSIESVTGYPSDSFHRDPELFLRVVEPEDRAVMEELFSRNGDGPRTRVVRIRRRDGDPRSVAVQSLVREDDEGLRIHGAMRDVSGWSVEAGMPPDLSTVLNALDDAVIFVDTERRIRFFNRGAEELFGWSAEEVLGRHAAAALWHDDDRDLQEAFGERALRGESFTMEIPLRTNDGGRPWVWVSANPVRDATGELQGVLGICRNVTEERLRRLERKRIDELVSASPAVIFTAEPSPEDDFRITFITSNVRDQFGYEPEAFTDNPGFWADHLHPDDRERTFEALSRLLDEGHIVTEHRFRRSDGAYRWIRHEMRLVRGEAGEPEKIVGHCLDITERREAEEELQEIADNLVRTATALDESRRRYREAQAIASLGSFTRDLESGRVETTKEFRRILGLDEDDQPDVFDDVFQRIHPDDREHALELKARLEEEGELVETEFRIRRPDGEVRWVEARAEMDDDGGMARIRGTFQDVTERKETELELERFFTVSLDPLCIADAGGRFLRVNPAFTEILGWSQAELLERGFFDLVHPDDRDVTVETMAALKDAGSAEAFENRYRTAADDYRWFLWKAVPDPSRERVYAAARDITERKRAEEATREARENLEDLVRERTAELRDSERRFRDMVEHAPLGIARTVPGGRILTANEVFARILGYEDTETLMEEVRLSEGVYVDPSERERLLKRAGEKGDIRGEEVRWRRRDGKVIWVRIDAVVEPADEHGGEHFLSFVQDITEERSLEEQLLQSQKMEAVGTLAGGVAHDFNNLLTPILTNAELALQELGADHPVREDLEDIRSAARRAAELTGQILSFSRKDEFEAVPVDVTEVVAGMERMLNRTLPDDVKTELHLADEPCRSRADPNQLEQVVMNLAVNARDAMPDGGRLTLEVRSVDLDEEYADAHIDVEPGPYVLLEVSDTGVGMEAETISRIFEPFYTTKDVGKGTGLGLSTVYAIVRRFGGQIGVYSEPGVGTVFRVYLPRLVEDGEPQVRSADPPAVEKAGGSGAGAPAVVLLAEDDDRVRRSAVRVLRGAGYEVLEAADGAEALAVFERRGGSIDLLVTDVIMPEMDGGELAERCAEIRSDLPVLFMSGYTERSLHRRSTLGDEVAFLQKPFTPTELTRRIRELLPG